MEPENRNLHAYGLRATEKLVESLIPVIDDFERSIAYAEGNGEEGLLGGIKAVHNKIGEVLKKEGVEIIGARFCLGVVIVRSKPL